MATLKIKIIETVVITHGLAEEGAWHLGPAIEKTLEKGQVWLLDLVSHTMRLSHEGVLEIMMTIEELQALQDAHHVDTGKPFYEVME